MAPVKTERIIQALIVVCLALLVWVIAGTYQERIVVAGDSAPSFTVTTEDGKTISPSNFGGKLLVVHFWATWCPPCVTETPSLNEFQKQYAKDGGWLGCYPQLTASWRIVCPWSAPQFIKARMTEFRARPGCQDRLRLRNLPVSGDLHRQPRRQGGREGHQQHRLDGSGAPEPDPCDARLMIHHVARAWEA